MAKARIKVLRGSNDKIANNLMPLEPGQPLYNTSKNYLTIGKTNTSKIQDLPIDVRQVKGWYNDSNAIGTSDLTKPDYTISGNSENGLFLKSVNKINLNIEDSNIVNITKDSVNINKSIVGNTLNINKINIGSTIISEDTINLENWGSDLNIIGDVYIKSSKNNDSLTGSLRVDNLVESKKLISSLISTDNGTVETWDLNSAHINNTGDISTSSVHINTDYNWYDGIANQSREYWPLVIGNSDGNQIRIDTDGIGSWYANDTPGTLFFDTPVQVLNRTIYPDYTANGDGGWQTSFSFSGGYERFYRLGHNYKDGDDKSYFPAISVKATTDKLMVWLSIPRFNFSRSDGSIWIFATTNNSPRPEYSTSLPTWLISRPAGDRDLDAYYNTTSKSGRGFAKIYEPRISGWWTVSECVVFNVTPGKTYNIAPFVHHEGGENKSCTYYIPALVDIQFFGVCI